jgi:hypothetical protein
VGEHGLVVSAIITAIGAITAAIISAAASIWVANARRQAAAHASEPSPNPSTQRDRAIPDAGPQPSPISIQIIIKIKKVAFGSALAFAAFTGGTTLILLSPSSRPHTLRRNEAVPARIQITFTQTPPFGNGNAVRTEPIAGRVSGVDPSEYRIVVYAYDANWYVQPYDTDPVTAINYDGTWRSDTHPGRKYAALLVKPSFKPPSEIKSLPGGDDVLTTAVVENTEQ